MDLTVIIPTYNEAGIIRKLINRLISEGMPLDKILIADGGSTDRTTLIAYELKVKVVNCVKTGRSFQMNQAAALVTSDWIYFLHADTLPPVNFIQEIQKSIDAGNHSGCFRSTFDSNNVLLKINAYFTRFNILWCRGGDQSLYVNRSLFNEIGGFCEDAIIMEDYDLIEKLQEKSRFNIMDKAALVSARKYDHNSYFRVMYANFIAFRMYHRGESKAKIRDRYVGLLRVG